MDDLDLEAMYNFIVAIIDKHFTGIYDHKYDALEKIIGKESLEYFTYYLKLDEEEACSSLLEDLLGQQDIKEQLSALKNPPILR